MRRWLKASLVACMVAAFTVPLAGTGSAKPVGGGTKGDTIEVGPDVSARLVTSGLQADPRRSQGRTRSGRREPDGVGLDDVAGRFYTKNYVLLARGKHSEVWVATGERTFNGLTTTDLNFQAGDCRNGARTVVTQAQAKYLINQFDDNIYPIEADAFSVAPNRNGAGAPLAAALGLPPNYYGGGRVAADPAQIGQVVMNLLLNAIHAITPPGRIEGRHEGGRQRRDRVHRHRCGDP